MYLVDRIKYDEDPNLKLGGGSEGSVFPFPDDPQLCVKLWHETGSPDDAQMAKFRAGKILHICQLGLSLPKRFIIPLKPAYNAKGKVAGFLMHLVGRRFFKIMQLLKEQFRIDHGIDLAWISTLFADIFDDTETLHGGGITIGDINTGCILVSDKRDRAFVDADSWSYGKKYPCLATTELFAHPDLYPNLTKSSGGFVPHQPHHDRFSFAVMFTLMAIPGAHPFRMGIHKKYFSLQERAKNGITLFDKDVTYPPMLPRPELLSDELLDAIIGVLKGHSDSLDTALLRTFSNELVLCKNCGTQYHSSRKSCPKCQEKTMLDIKVVELIIEEIFRSKGTLLFIQLVDSKLHLVCRVDDKLQIVTIDEQKHVEVITSNLPVTKGSRYRFFRGHLVVCEDPYAEPPVTLRIYKLGKQLIETETTTTLSFQNEGAIFDTTGERLYRIAGNMLNVGAFTGNLFLERPIAQVHSTQTWFTTDRQSGTSQEVLFGFDAAFIQRQWFVIVGDGKNYENHTVNLEPLRTDEKLEDFSVYFNKNSVLPVRKTRYRGRDYVRTSIVSHNGQVVEDNMLADTDEGYDCWSQLHGKLFQKSSVLHVTATAGIVKYDITTRRYVPVDDTSGLMLAGDRLLRFGKSITVVRRNQILGMKTK